MPAYFFSSTESANSQITKLYDFIWPTAAAMWNLRWQVDGFIRAMPNASPDQLRARFIEGADIQGANLKRACIEHSWNEQKEAFARIILANSIAIYESWIEETLTALGKNTQLFQKSLQFPGASGIVSAVGAITAVESLPLKDCLYPILKRSRHTSLTKLNEMLLCYRYFKELRNCDMHGGGVADSRLVASYNDFLPFATTSALGVSEVPIHTAPSLGQITPLSLRGVVGFTHIILKIITTLDSEFCRSKQAEKSFIRKWRLRHGLTRMLPAAPGKREAQIVTMTKRAGFPEPIEVSKLGDWLTNLGLTRF